jgi:hypothetical protein
MPSRIQKLKIIPHKTSLRQPIGVYSCLNMVSLVYIVFQDQ